MIFLCFFLSLLVQCKFAIESVSEGFPSYSCKFKTWLLSLLSFSYLITPNDAQASSAFSALTMYSSSSIQFARFFCLKQLYWNENRIENKSKYEIMANFFQPSHFILWPFFDLLRVKIHIKLMGKFMLCLYACFCSCCYQVNCIYALALVMRLLILPCRPHTS